MSHYNYMKHIATGNTWNVTGHKSAGLCFS